MSPCTKPDCEEKGCCLNCINYEGSTEFTPMNLNINCKEREGVSLKIHGYPKQNGVSLKDNCQHWGLKTK